jgi:hypothetical protein
MRLYDLALKLIDTNNKNYTVKEVTTNTTISVVVYKHVGANSPQQYTSEYIDSNEHRILKSRLNDLHNRLQNKAHELFKDELMSELGEK